jgi:hypothetical protein
MASFDEIKALIEDVRDYIDFADFGEGVSEECIAKAEERLGFSLPESYKWWLKNYGGGEVFGYEIFSVYEDDFDEVDGGDIVQMYERSKGEIGKRYIPLCATDEEFFCFLVSDNIENNEYPVYDLNETVYNLKGIIKEKNKYADNFLDFLYNFIDEQVVIGIKSGRL